MLLSLSPSLCALSLVLPVLAIQGDSTNVARTLVPAKRALHLERRDLWRHDIIPSSHVTLNYGISTFSEPSAHISFVAHDERPILLLEDIEHALKSITCTASRDGHDMKLIFEDQETHAEAMEVWSKLPSFTIVTAHPTCNQHNERAAWLVQEVNGDGDRLMTDLLVVPVGLDTLGRSCSIRYHHTGAGIWQTTEQYQLHKRAVTKSSQSKPAVVTSSLPPHATLFPLTNGNVTMVSQNATETLGDSDFQLTCLDCTFKASFTLGIEIDADVVAPCNSFAQNCATVTKASTNFTVVDLEQPVDLEVFLGKSFSHTLNFTIIQIPLDGFVVANIINIGPSVGVELGLGLDVSAALNFTLGATAQVPSGTFASFDLVDGSGKWAPTFQTTGWDQAGVTVHPVHVNSGQFNVTADIYLAPFVEVALELFNTGFATRLLQEIPKYTVDAALVTAVNRNCQPIGPDDFETFDTAFVVGADVEIATEVHFGFEGFLVPDALAQLGYPVAYDSTFFKKDFPVPPSNSTGSPKCIIISDDSSSNATASSLTGVPGPTGTMVLAESAVPTWDFAKIESYSSANGHLPTNVDYSLMVRATAVPPQLQQAVQVITTGNSSDGSPSGAPGSSPSGSSGGGSGGGSSGGAAGSLESLRIVTCAVVMLSFVMSALLLF